MPAHTLSMQQTGGTIVDSSITIHCLNPRPKMSCPLANTPAKISSHWIVAQPVGISKMHILPRILQQPRRSSVSNPINQHCHHFHSCHSTAQSAWDGNRHSLPCPCLDKFMKMHSMGIKWYITEEATIIRPWSVGNYIIFACMNPNHAAARHIQQK